MDPQTNLHDFFVLILTAKQTANWVDASCLVLWLVEYFELLPLEVEFVWSKEWTIYNVLFYILRYWPFVQIPLIMIYFLTTLPANACVLYLRILAGGTIFNICLAQVAMFIRVYAIGGHSHALKIYIISHVLLSHAGIFAMCIRLHNSMKYISTPFHEHLGCPAINADYTSLVIVYAIILFNETTNMILTLYFGYKKYLNLVHAPLLQVLYLDGTMYFVLVAAISMANIIITNVVSNAFSYTLILLQYILHNTVIIRMTLHLRQVASASALGIDSSGQLSTLQFQNRYTMERSQEGYSNDTQSPESEY